MVLVLQRNASNTDWLQPTGSIIHRGWAEHRVEHSADGQLCIQPMSTSKALSLVVSDTMYHHHDNDNDYDNGCRDFEILLSDVNCEAQTLQIFDATFSHFGFKLIQIYSQIQMLMIKIVIVPVTVPLL